MSNTLPPLLFVHVPKTGGYALWVALEEAYGTDQSVRIDNLSDRSAATPEMLQKHRLVSGHTSYPDLLASGLGDYHAVSIVRDPVERSISSYHYVRSLPDHPMYSEFSPLSPEDWTCRMEGRPLRHRTLHHLAGVQTLADALPVLDRYALIFDYADMATGVARLSAMIGRPLHLKRVNETDMTGAAEFTKAQRERIRAGLAEEYRLLDYVRERWGAVA
jgi:hypothetical protein